jgi:hypothetical protein
MALRPVVTKEEFEKLPDAIKSEYKIQGEDYHLDIPEGFVPKSKLDEFRNNNVSLMKERDQLKSKYGDIDADAAREALKMKQELEEKKLIASGDVDKVVEQRVSKMRDEHKKERDRLDAELAAKNSRLSELLIDNQIKDVALKPEIGVLPKAITTVVKLAKDVWTLDKDGKPVAMNGDQAIYGKDGTPITMAEWIANLKTEHDYLFGQPVGGGANSGSSGTPGTKKKRSEMTVTEKTDFITKHGRPAYEALPY